MQSYLSFKLLTIEGVQLKLNPEVFIRNVAHCPTLEGADPTA